MLPFHELIGCDQCDAMKELRHGRCFIWGAQPERVSMKVAFADTAFTSKNYKSSTFGEKLNT